MKTQMEKVLVDRELVAPSNSPDAIELLMTISNYDSTLYVNLLSDSGRHTSIFITCNVLQNGADMGKIKVRRTENAIGVGTILPGRWKAIINSAAEDIADDLQDKIRQGK